MRVGLQQKTLRNGRHASVFNWQEVKGLEINSSKGECKMDLLVEWATVLFFLLYGLAAFVPALNTDMFRKVTAVLALIVGVLGLLVLLGMA